MPIRMCETDKNFADYSSLLDSLLSVDQMNTEIAEHVDLLNNLLEQRISIDLVPETSCRIVERHPEWKDRIKSRLDLLITDAIVDFRNQCLCSKLGEFMRRLARLKLRAEDAINCRCSLTFDDDLRTVHLHLEEIAGDYTKKLDDFACLTETTKEYQELRRKSKQPAVVVRRIGETYESWKAAQRLEQDLKLIVASK